MSTNLNKSEPSLHSKDPKKEFLDWLESLKISRYWLDTMNQSDSLALCKEIYQNLKKLTQLNLLAKEKLSALIEIDSCLQGVHAKLHDNYLEGKLPLPEDQQEMVEIIIFSYMELANAYYAVITSNKFSREKLSQQHLSLAACKGFKGLGVVFLTASETYANPTQGFWLLCYQLFSVSEELNLLDNKVKIDEAIYSAAVLFRQLIIFHLIDKKLLFPKEIEKVFEALLRGINYIQSYILALLDVTNSSPAEIYGFSLHKDEPPSIQRNISLATAKILRYVEKAEVVKIIQFLIREAKEQAFYIEKTQQQPNSVNPELLSRILNTLDHQKSKRQTRISQKLACKGIIGIDSLVDVLLEKEGKKKLTSIKEQKIKDDFDDFEMSLDWESEKKLPKANSILEELKIIDSSINGYGISWNSTTVGKLQVGEVIGVIVDANSGIKKIEIGLIRRIDVSDESVFFGVELIGFESTLINIVRNNAEVGEWLLFLFGSPNYDVGILCHKESHYQTGEAVFVQLPDKKIPCSLGAIFNSTPLLDHIGLSY